MSKRTLSTGHLLLLLIFGALTSFSCGTGGVETGAAPASTKQISISPGNATLDLGATQQFTSSAPAAWGFQNQDCDSSLCGYFSAGGMYHAPQALPPSSVIILTATSTANPAVSATANVSLVPGFSLSISGPSIVATNGHITYFATYQSSPGADPLMTTNWSISGANCVAARLWDA